MTRELTEGERKDRERMMGCLTWTGAILFAVGATAFLVVSDQRSKAAEQKAAIPAEVAALWDEVKSLGRECDRYTSAMAEALEMEGYPDRRLNAHLFAKTAGDRCSDAWLAVGRLSPPKGLKKPEREKFRHALKVCGSAYLTRASTADQISRALDTDMSLKRLGTIQGLSSAGQQESLACVVQLEAAAASVGAKLDPPS